MGAVQLTVTVKNPDAPHRCWDALFLVDSGSVDCVVPGEALRGIGLSPTGKRTYELPDGLERTLHITTATLELLGQIVVATICFGQDHIEPVLGLAALESVGLKLAPTLGRSVPWACR